MLRPGRCDGTHLLVIKLESVLLQLALSFSGIDVHHIQDKACDVRPELMGSYLIEKDQVVLCIDNIEREDQDIKTVLMHELLHASHENFGVSGSFIPEPILTHLVRANLDSEEVMGVIMTYPEEQIDQELEVRVFDGLMSEWHMAAILSTSRLVELLRLALGS